MKNQSISIKFGIFTGLFLIIYFVLLGALELTDSPIFSLVNALICAVGIFLAISERSNKEQFTSKNAFKTGVFTGVYATIIFTAFFAIFAGKSDGIIANLIHSVGLESMNYGLLLVSVFVLGIISVYVVTFILMRLFKRSWNLA